MSLKHYHMPVPVLQSLIDSAHFEEIARHLGWRKKKMTEQQVLGKLIQ